MDRFLSKSRKRKHSEDSETLTPEDAEVINAAADADNKTVLAAADAAELQDDENCDKHDAAKQQEQEANDAETATSDRSAYKQFEWLVSMYITHEGPQIPHPRDVGTEAEHINTTYDDFVSNVYAEFMRRPHRI